MAEETTIQILINKLPEICMALAALVGAIAGIISVIRTGKIKADQVEAKAAAERMQRGVATAIQSSALNREKIDQVTQSVTDVHDSVNGKMQEIIDLTGAATGAVATLAERDRAVAEQKVAEAMAGGGAADPVLGKVVKPDIIDPAEGAKP